jgi:hypothetical protein
MKGNRLGLFLLGAFALSAGALAQSWPHSSTSLLSARIPPPEGFRPLKTKPKSFGEWLRRIPLKPAGSIVHLYNGKPKTNPLAAFAVVDLDVDPVDLQQCADAVMRLRAEYLRDAGREEEIHFLTVGGGPLDWREWKREKKSDGGYKDFRKFLKIVFDRANSASLDRQLERVSDPGSLQPGDVFIKGGYPGHAVLVLDAAENAKGERVFLIGQSYMPAQDFHVLRNPLSSLSPWYGVKDKGWLVTPEWIFDWKQLKRFSKP